MREKLNKWLFVCAAIGLALHAVERGVRESFPDGILPDWLTTASLILGIASAVFRQLGAVNIDIPPPKKPPMFLLTIGLLLAMVGCGGSLQAREYMAQTMPCRVLYASLQTAQATRRMCPEVHRDADELRLCIERAEAAISAAALSIEWCDPAGAVGATPTASEPTRGAKARRPKERWRLARAPDTPPPAVLRTQWRMPARYKPPHGLG